MPKISNVGKAAGGVLGLATVAATAVAGYYFFGKDGKGHRKQAVAWSKNAKMEMLEKIKQMKDVSHDSYQKALKDVLAKYKEIKDVDPKQLQKFGQELMAHWEKISKDAAKLMNNSPAKKLNQSS
jgi:hypothetical protein